MSLSSFFIKFIAFGGFQSHSANFFSLLSFFSVARSNACGLVTFFIGFIENFMVRFVVFGNSILK